MQRIVLSLLGQGKYIFGDHSVLRLCLLGIKVFKVTFVCIIVVHILNDFISRHFERLAVFHA